ncbi:MAG TPA: hypothetical protein PKV43_01395, partial [Armatimonadota bacterium]|nr:hypothetical protein [Armatimonadota bacterium]
CRILFRLSYKVFIARVGAILLPDFILKQTGLPLLLRPAGSPGRAIFSDFTAIGFAYTDGLF